MKTVILLSGKKGTGKDTSFDFIKDYFKCEECGGTGRKGEQKFVYQMVYPHCEFCVDKGYGYKKRIKKLSFADSLKEMCKNVFGLSDKQCYGESGERETPSSVRWAEISDDYKHLMKEGATNSDFLMAREILQFVGTNVMRKFCSSVWARAAVISATRATEDIVVFTDARFPDEINFFEDLQDSGQINLIVIRLHRNTGFIDSHESETALDTWDENWFFEYDVYNNGTLEALREELFKILRSRGF